MVLLATDKNRIVHEVRADTEGRLIISSIGEAAPVRKYVVLSTTGETALWTPTAGKKFVITDMVLSSSATASVTLRDGTAGTTIGMFRLSATVGLPVNLMTPIVSAAADRVLTAQTSAITGYIFISGYEI